MSESVKVDVRGGPSRCAYCHGDVAIEERAACAACFAAHHVECWRADGRCATCRATIVLARDDAAKLAPRYAPLVPPIEPRAGSRDAGRFAGRIARIRWVGPALATLFFSVWLVLSVLAAMFVDPFRRRSSTEGERNQDIQPGPGERRP